MHVPRKMVQEDQVLRTFDEKLDLVRAPKAAHPELLRSLDITKGNRRTEADVIADKVVQQVGSDGLPLDLRIKSSKLRIVRKIGEGGFCHSLRS